MKTFFCQQIAWRQEQEERMKFYEYIMEFTGAYKEYEGKPPALREAACVEVMSRYEFLPLNQELLAGRKRILPLGFSNEPLLGRSVGWFYDEARIMEAMAEEQASEEQMEKVRELVRFWQLQETRYNLRMSYPADIKEAMPEDIYWEHSQIAFPLYRIVGAYMDYDKLLRLGLDGMRQMIADYRQKAVLKGEDTSLYDGCKKALDALSAVCRRYAGEAMRQNRTELAKALMHIATAPPETFIEALQLAWLYSLISGVLNYGRADDYLGDYLERDLQSGILTEEEALEYLCSWWRLIDERKTVFHGRIFIGGKGRHHESAADRFAMLAMEASKIVAEAEPQLSLRFYEGQDPALMEKALDVIGEGKIYPMLYNDDVNIPSVSKAFHISEKEAEDYVAFGCGEYVLNKKSMGSPNGIINLLKALEVTITGGEDLYDGKPLGLKLGPITAFDTFDSFYDAYKKQLGYYFGILARQEQLEYDFCAKSGAFLFITMLMEDCLERNRSVCGGGVRYLGGTLETYGNINTINSLYAIKDVVYERQLVSPARLLEALRADFAGFEDVRRLLMDSEKYGNDLDGVDSLAADFHESICHQVSEMKKLTKLHSYMIVIINNEANTILGRFTWASADGRRAGEPMANANNPAGGTDTNGVTAMMNSLVKLRTDIHAGAVQNMTFSREFFQENRKVLRAVLFTYFKNGGQQAMINVLNRGDLEAAMRQPEKYAHLMVRVGGFSARFVTLAPDVQKEIASRTLY